MAYDFDLYVIGAGSAGGARFPRLWCQGGRGESRYLGGLVTSAAYRKLVRRHCEDFEQAGFGWSGEATLIGH